MSQPPPLPPPLPSVPPPIISYATPGQFQFQAATTAPVIGRMGNRLIVSKNHPLPPRCVKCNQPADPRYLWNKTLYWHNPLLYLLLFAGLLVYVIVAVVMNKKTWVQAGLCTIHGKRRSVRVLIGWMIALGGLIALILGIYLYNNPPSSGSPLGPFGIVLGIALILASLFWAIFAVRVLWPKKIDNNHAEFAGAGPEFLDSLPALRRFDIIRRMSQPPLPIGNAPLLPYATPAEFQFAPVVGRLGDRLIVSKDGPWPMRCVKCNAPADPRYVWKKKVYWRPRVFVPNIFAYIAMVLATRKGARVAAGLCGFHGKRRRKRVSVGWAITTAGLVSLIGGIYLFNTLPDRLSWVGFAGILAGILLPLTAIIWWTFTARVLWPAEIDDHYAQFLGADRRFLDSLPALAPTR